MKGEGRYTRVFVFDGRVEFAKVNNFGIAEPLVIYRAHDLTQWIPNRKRD